MERSDYRDDIFNFFCPVALLGQRQRQMGRWDYCDDISEFSSPPPNLLGHLIPCQCKSLHRQIKYGKKLKYLNWDPPKNHKYGKKLKYPNWDPQKCTVL